MPRFLDLMTSSNSSTFGSPNTAMSTSSANPDLFGGIGLQTQNVAGNGSAGTGSLVVDLSGTIGISAAAGVTFEVRIVRNSGTIAGPIIYTAVHASSGSNPQVVSFSAQDLNAPAGLLTTYAAFCDTTGAVTRTGPEVFYGIAAQK